MKRLLLSTALLYALTTHAQKAEDYPYLTIGARLGIQQSGYSFDFIAGYDTYPVIFDASVGYSGAIYAGLTIGGNFHISEKVKIQPLAGITTQEAFIGLRIHVGEVFLQGNIGQHGPGGYFGFKGPLFE